MVHNDMGIGERIAALRVRRHLTQAELAGLVGISVSLVKKIESGIRPVSSFTRLLDFAQALKVKDLRELTNVPLPLLPDGARGHPAAPEVRAALTCVTPPTGELPELPALARRVDDAWQAFHSGSPWRFAASGQALPGLIRDARRALVGHTDEDRREANRIASALYRLTRVWSKHTGEQEISWVAADRAVSTALNADDRDLAAAAGWELAMVMSSRGHISQSRQIVYDTIATLHPHMSDPSPHRLSVWGALHLLGAVGAGRENDDRQVTEMLREAERTAAISGERNDFRLAFGPTNVAIHRATIEVESGRAASALRIAEHTDVSGSPSVERRVAHHIDLARAYLQRQDDVAAVAMLRRVEAESPEVLQHAPLVRETIRVLVQRERQSFSAELRPLARTAGIIE